MLPKFKLFPSPHSGILFLYQPQLEYEDTIAGGFRPLIRGFFFYEYEDAIAGVRVTVVSVPSFGDSFFIT